MKNSTKLAIAGILVSMVMIEVASAARSMRCGTHVISTGQRSSPGMYEVLKRCGEPKTRYGNTWVYEKSSSVTYVLTFSSNGQISSIE